jgi:AcrR family transcriptional regulator
VSEVDTVRLPDSALPRGNGTAARRTRASRPRNRAAIIVSAASELFRRHGYDAVTMGDIAAAVGVTPPALYRHFPSKLDILVAASRGGIARFVEVVDRESRSGGLERVVQRLAEEIESDEDVGALWGREIRRLDAATRTSMEQDVAHAAARVGELVRARRPELGERAATTMAWCGLSALVAASATAPRTRGEHPSSVVVEFAMRVFDAPLAASCDTARPSGFGLGRRSRREQLIGSAIEQFADRGFTAVSMEDLGAANGISGPSVHHYFPTKQDLLATISRRGMEWFGFVTAHALRHAVDEADAVRNLIDDYTEFAIDNAGLIHTLFTDSVHLADPYREQLRVAERDYLAEWSELITDLGVYPDVRTTGSAIRVFFAVVNDSVRNPSQLADPHLRDVLVASGNALLLPADQATSCGVTTQEIAQSSPG